jgi:hypothetical protein
MKSYYKYCFNCICNKRASHQASDKIDPKKSVVNGRDTSPFASQHVQSAMLAQCSGGYPSTHERVQFASTYLDLSTRHRTERSQKVCSEIQCGSLGLHHNVVRTMLSGRHVSKMTCKQAN